jgi:hypothetical protein
MRLGLRWAFGIHGCTREGSTGEGFTSARAVSVEAGVEDLVEAVATLVVEVLADLVGEISEAGVREEAGERQGPGIGD